MMCIRADEHEQEKTVPEQEGARTLILHVGDHKTGTTSIQHAFVRKQIHIDGVCPLYTSRLDHNALPARFRAVLKQSSSPLGKAAHERLSELTRMMAASEAPICVISAEEFEGFDPAGLKQLVDLYFGEIFDRIRVIAYVRPHLQRILSGYAERTKIGIFSGTLEAFFDTAAGRGDYFYTPRFRAWRKAFGEDFILRPFLRPAMHNGDLIDDFIISALGPVRYTTDISGSQNESLSLEDLLRLKYLHGQIQGRVKLFHHCYGWALSLMVNELPAPENATRVQMHRSLAEQVAKHYRADARKLDQSFFDGNPYMEDAIDADLEKACDAPQPSRAEEVFPDSEMRSLALSAKMTALMLENGKAPWSDHYHHWRVQQLHGAQG